MKMQVLPLHWLILKLPFEKHIAMISFHFNLPIKIRIDYYVKYIDLYKIQNCYSDDIL